MEFVALGKFMESCLEWEHPIRSAIAFACFMTIAYFAEPYMAPVALLLIFLKNYVIRSYLDPRSHHHGHNSWEDHLDGIDDDDEEHEEEKEEKKTLKARLQAIQEVTAMVQNSIGMVASLGESVKNTFNFSVPFLSWLAIGALAAIAVLLYYVSPRYLVMAWGLNKFTKKLLRPNFVNNNELLDFLSRVPDDEQLLSLRELRLCADEDASGGGGGGAAGQGSPKRKDAQKKKKQ